MKSSANLKSKRAASFVDTLTLSKTILLLVGLAGFIFFTACGVPAGGRVIGGQPVDITELATYPGANELSAGQSTIIDPIFKTAESEPSPFIGLGIEVRRTQRTFGVPKETTFADVKLFYADKLQAAGWREDPNMRVFSTALNAGSPNLQGAIWVRIDQTLLIALATEPARGNKELLLSLALH